MGSSPHLWFFVCKTTRLASKFLVSMGPSPYVGFLHAKQRLLNQNYKSLWVPDLTYVSFLIQNSVFSTRIASLYGSQPPSVVFACKTATLGSEFQVSIGPRPHLSFCACKTTAWLAPESLVSMGPRPHQSLCACKTAWLAPELLVSTSPRPHLSFCACKTTWLASELLVSMGPSLHLWFLHAKQRLLQQNYKSLWVPDFACWFVNAKQRA